jgi:hypothetical protein
MGGMQELFSPPGWVFGFSNTVTSSSITLLHWILENDWEGDGIPKIGIINTDDAQPTESAKEIKAYLNKHPNEYEYVGGLTVPLGTMTVTSEAKSLKDKGCDYIVVTTPSIFGPLLRDLREFGSEAKLLDCSGGMSSFAKVLVQLVGWDMLDGCYSTAQSYTWSDSAPIVDLARTLANRYHSEGEAQEILGVGGYAYVGPAHQLVPMLEVLQQAVKNVGAENLNGQAYYDAAIDYKTTSSMWSGCPEFSFSETRRKLIDYTLITGFKGGDVKDYVTISGWLPDIVD